MSLVNHRAKNHPQQVKRDGPNLEVDDRETPPEIFDPLNAEHRFTLDVAASRENAKAPYFFDLAIDGLAQPWVGRIWCNPPYSNIGPWVAKACQSIHNGAEVVVMLLPANRTEQKWWQEHIEPWRDGKDRSDGVRLSVRFLPGRPRFFRPSGQVGGPKGDRPPFGCCVLTWTRSDSGAMAA